jgi:hypothetical protein
MKLIAYYVDPAVASGVKSRLRKAGVLTELSNEDPHIVKPSRSGATRIGLWVVHDDQFGDAVKLLEDPDHVPKHVIDVEQTSETSSPGFENRLSKTLTTIILGICLFGLIVYTVIGAFNDPG